DSPRQRVPARVLARAAGDEVLLECDGLEGAPGELDAPDGGRAEGREAAGEHAAGGTLPREQRAPREQMVGGRLIWRRALAPQLVALQRPRERVPVGRTSRGEVAERPQLVLLVLAHDEHPVRMPAAVERQRAPRAGAGARPRERAERDTPVAEQAQRAQQVP